jgi:hypothetical protein
VASQSAADVEEYYTRGGLWIAIVVTVGWHVAVAAPIVVTTWLGFGFIRSGVLIWLAFAVIGAVSAVPGLRGSGPHAVLPWLVCAVLLAGALAGALTAPGGSLGQNDFAFGVGAWFGLVALWRRRFAELIAFLAADGLTVVVATAVLRDATRSSVAGFVMTCCTGGLLPITIYLGSRAVAATARRAAEAQDAAARTRNTRLAAEAVQAARRARYETIRATVVRLLDGLASGSLDLGAEQTRQEIAVAVTRLRRYLVENDDVPDPLSHELRACADAAERRGVAVDLIAAAGTIPMLSVGIRRALTEPVIQVLAATTSRARITVVASAAEVAVAIVADARLAVPIVSAGDSIQCDFDEEGGKVWAQARWTAIASSASLS